MKIINTRTRFILLMLFLLGSSVSYCATLNFIPSSSDTLRCGLTRSITAQYVADFNTSLRGYEVTFHSSDELSFSTEDIVDLGAFSGIGNQFFNCYWNVDGSVTVAVALLGETPGLCSSGSLFSINVIGQQSGTGQLIVDEVIFRNLENQDIPAYSQDATIEVYCEPVPVELYFNPESIQIDQGETSTIAVMIKEPVEIRTIEMTVTYNSELIQSNSGTPGALFQNAGCPIFEHFEDGELNQWYGSAVLLGDDCWIDSAGELYVWEFTGLIDGVSPVVAAEVYLYSPDASLIEHVTISTTQVIHNVNTSFGTVKAMFR